MITLNRHKIYMPNEDYKDSAMKVLSKYAEKIRVKDKTKEIFACLIVLCDDYIWEEIKFQLDLKRDEIWY